MLPFFPRDVLNEGLDLTESVSEGFSTYSFIRFNEILNSRQILPLWWYCNRWFRLRENCNDPMCLQVIGVYLIRETGLVYLQDSDEAEPA